jgi:hypothetical protein
MKNAGYTIRKVYKQVLDTILYKENPIVVYENFLQNTTPETYIHILNILESPVVNDAKFMREMSVDIEIYTEQYKYQNTDKVDEIASLVLEVLIPNVSSNELDSEEFINQDFQFGYVNLTNSRYLFEVGEKGTYITRKILTFNQTLIEKNGTDSIQPPNY